MKIIIAWLLSNLLLLTTLDAGAQIVDGTDTSTPVSKAATQAPSSDQDHRSEHYKKANKETDDVEASDTEPVALQQGVRNEDDDEDDQPLIVSAPI